MRVEDGSALADGRAEDVPVEVVSDPQLLAGLSLAGVEVEDTLNELWHVGLANE